ncbi:MAG: DUF3048 domain-containing protein, partial [Anaerolineae bacterium]|nr:DUF3048 domain-containing protein [Anaerolineae bacterium]
MSFILNQNAISDNSSAMIIELLLAGALLLARGQAQPTPAPLPDGPIIGPTATPPPLTATPAGATGADSNPPGINPLTGLPLADPAVLARRPILVKVSNSPALVRPQAGIGAADLVFEHYTEAGVTRFSALFYSTLPPRVGSIRSARLIDYELAPMYQALLAFAGGSIGVEKRIFGSAAVTEVLCADREDRARCAVEAEVIAPSGLVPPSEFADRAYKGVFYGPPYYFRDEQIPVPHNLFVNLPALADLAARQGQQQAVDLRGLAFAPAAPAGAEGAGLMLEVRYRTTLVEWHYHPADGLYYRSSDRQPH